MTLPKIEISEKTIKRLTKSFTKEKINSDIENFIKNMEKYESNQFHINEGFKNLRNQLELQIEEYRINLISEISNNNSDIIIKEVKNHVLDIYQKIKNLLSKEEKFNFFLNHWESAVA